MKTIILILSVISANCAYALDIQRIENELHDYAEKILSDKEEKPSTKKQLRIVLDEGRYEVIAAIRLHNVGLGYLLSSELIDQDYIDTLDEAGKSIVVPVRDELIQKKDHFYTDLDELREYLNYSKYLSYKLNQIIEKANKPLNGDAKSGAH